MRRLKQHPIGWLLLLDGAAFPAVARDEPRGAGRTVLAPPAYSEKIPGTKVSFAMVGIPGGTFRMGSPKGEKGRRGD